MTDILLKDNGDGGDAILIGNDIKTIDGLQNMVYLALFGGNKESSTEGPKLQNEQALDWWGNALLMENNKAIMFNSQTEKTLLTTALNSSGRIKIQQVVASDLEFMKAFSIITVDTAITDPDRLEIRVRIKQPDNQQDLPFIFIWDATKKELIQ